MSGNVIIRKDVEKREVTVERILKGPQDLVWRCLTTPEYIDQWWGPEGWATETKMMNVKPGGIWHFRMYGGGAEIWGLAEYETVERPSQIIYTESASNAAGEKQANKQQHVTIGITSEASAQTVVSVRTRFASIADLEAMMSMGMAEGYAGAFDKLETVIKKEHHGTN